PGGTSSTRGRSPRVARPAALLEPSLTIGGRGPAPARAAPPGPGGASARPPRAGGGGPSRRGPPRRDKAGPGAGVTGGGRETELPEPERSAQRGDRGSPRGGWRWPPRLCQPSNGRVETNRMASHGLSAGAAPSPVSNWNALTVADTFDFARSQSH